MATSNFINLNRVRMTSAIKNVENVKTKLGKDASKYRALVRGFPLLLRSHGLGASILFLIGKSKGENGQADNEHKFLLDHLLGWLSSNALPDLIIDISKDKPSYGQWREILIGNEHLKNRQYLRIQRELLVYIDWLKRIAEGLIDAPK